MHGFYIDMHGPQNKPDTLERLLTHPHIDGAFVRAAWQDFEPQEKEFDRSVVDKAIDPWISAGKKVILGIITWSSGKIDQYPERDPRPEWFKQAMADEGFNLWDRRCLHLQRPFIEKLAEWYDGVDGIDAIFASIGHLGYVTAAAYPPTVEAFLDAGWNPDKWLTHAEMCMQLYRVYFTQTPIFIRGSSIVLPDPEHDHYVDTRDDIFRIADSINVLVGCNGLDPDPAKFIATGVPAVLSNLFHATEIGDDWPLAGKTKDRQTDENFIACCRNAPGGHSGIPVTGISAVKLLEDDANRIDKRHPDYSEACEAAALELKGKLL